YTFILEATKEVPRRVSHPSRKTIGIRVPDHRITLDFIEAAGTPLVSTTLIPDGEEQPLNDAEEIYQRYGNELAAVIDSGACSLAASTVTVLTGTLPEVLRRGQGDLAAVVLD